MKLIVCDYCDKVIILTRRKKSCRCGNISGKYCQDGLHAKIWVRSKSFSRVLGIENSVRYGAKQKGDVWIIKWDDSRIKVRDIVNEKK